MDSSEGTDRTTTHRSRCRVLAVEDDPDVAESFALLLQMSGNEVRAVNNGLAAIEVARQFHPDIAFIDIDLPGMSGYDLARVLRREHGTALRLFALTGFGQQRDVERAMEAGFDMHLVKPIGMETLDRLIGAHTQSPERQENERLRNL
jgi:DNA-binding response OmpR family regulator